MFAKLFDTPHGQILVTKDYDEDLEEPYRISMRGEQQKGIDPTTSFGFITEEQRDLSFDTVAQEQANNTGAVMHAMVQNLLKGE